MNDSLERILLNDLTIKIRKPERVGIAPVLLMLHGWTGDEDSMWVLTSKVPKTFLIIAPRAPFPITDPNFNGYTWVEKPSGKWSWFQDFLPAINKINNLLDDLSRQYEGDFESINIAGFSQGAALSYAYAMSNPNRVNKIAGLSGFLPANSEAMLSERPLEGKSVFVAHGSKDQIIKIDQAYEARDQLENAGANVKFCESEEGHRLGSGCYTAFGEFISF